MSCPLITTLTDAELDKPYTNGNIPGVLPLSISNLEKGQLPVNDLNMLISNLKRSGVIPTMTSDTELFLKKQTELIGNLKTEYCYYYSRYKYSLHRLFKLIGSSCITQSKNDEKSMMQWTKYISDIKELNVKMNVLIQIIRSITDESLKSSTPIENEIKDFDKNIKETQLKLLEQNKIISSNQAITKLKKEMVKYTEEKGRYTDNLLKMYSVLNVVVLGLLVYVYKSVGE